MKATIGTLGKANNVALTRGVLARFKNELAQPSAGELKKRICATNLMALVETIKKETDELFKDLPNRLALQSKMVFFCVEFTAKLSTHAAWDYALKAAVAFLKENTKDVSDIGDKEVHRIIMVLALGAYAGAGDKEAKKLETLIKDMDLWI
jgi:hypothetical protein